MWYILAAVFGILYATLLEWLIHKYILHGLGKNKESYWAFHWHEHHKACRKNEGLDPHYDQCPLHSSLKKEVMGINLLVLLHSPLILFFPVFYITLVACAIRYLWVHWKAHQDAEWAKKNVPWHYEHHMGTNQDANWGVTNSFWDLVIGTRVKYLKKDSNDETDENNY